MQADDAWRAVAELAASQHGVFHRRQAAAHGLSTQRIRRAVLKGELVQHSRDVFVLASSRESWKRSLRAHTLAGGVASHRSAAALHGLDGSQPGPMEVTRDRTRSTSRGDVVLHRWRGLESSMVTQIDGIPCTNIATTLAQLGMVVSRSRVEQALDGALRDGVSIVWISRTACALARPGSSGVKVLQSLLADPGRSGALPDSWFERLLARIVADTGLPRPVLQHEILVAGRRRRFDLAFPDAKLGLEAHSRRHHFSVAAVERDGLRDLELAGAGWEVVYVTWAMISPADRLIENLARIYWTRMGQVAPNE